MNAPAIYISLANERARIKPAGYLGGELFGAFRAAIDGARFDRLEKANVCALDKLPPILKRLRTSGFHVQAGSELIRKLQMGQAERWLDLQSVQDRIELIDTQIQERARAEGHHRALFPFQKIGATWLALRRTAGLFDDQGLGKTLQTIAALPPQCAALIVCPKSVKGEWLKEVAKWRPQLNTRTVDARKPVIEWPRTGELVIYHYHILPKPHAPGCDGKKPPKPCQACAEVLSYEGGSMVARRQGHLLSCTGFEPEDTREKCFGCAPWLQSAPENMTLVGDEAQYLKSPKAGWTQAFRALRDAVLQKRGRVWGLSGTPVSNNPLELWSVYLSLGIAEEAFGNRKSFDLLFGAKEVSVSRDRTITKYSIPTPEMQVELVERQRRVSLRRMKHEVLPDLPTKRWREIPVPLDVKTFKSVDRLLSEDGGIEAIAAKLLGTEPGKEPTFKEMPAIRSLLATAKIDVMNERIELAEEEREPLVVFCAHRRPIDTLTNRPGWRTITGDTSAEDRKRTIEEFQAGKLKGVGCTIRAAGTGVTLTRSARMLFVDRDFTTTWNMQAEDRCLRIGQDRGVVVDILVADHPIDERVNQILLQKQMLIDASVDAARTSEGAAGRSSDETEAFMQQMREIQKEIALGRNPRRAAESAEEKITLERLGSCTFGRASEERIAADLLEQAHLVGLTDAQWALATRVAATGEERVIEIMNEPESVINDGMIMIDGDGHLPECKRVTEPGAECDCGSTPPGVRG